MQRFHLPTLLSLLLLVMLSACHSSKKSASTSPSTGTKVNVVENCRTLVDSYGDWNALSVPVSVSLKQPASLRISGTMTMMRGEYIHYSARVLGIEVAAVMITRDSIFAKEKLHKTYVAESIKSLTGKFPATVDNLQQLIFGHLFMIGTTDISRAVGDFEFESYPDFWTATTSFRGQAYTFTVDNASGNLKMLSAEIAGKYPVTASFDEFTPTVAGPAAKEVTLKAASAKSSFEASFTVNYGKARWQGVTPREWETPRGYKKINVSTLLKSLSSL